MKIRCLDISCFVLSVFVVSCCWCDDEKIIAVKEKPILTFAVAGHVSGNPDSSYTSIYPPFLEKIKRDHQELDFRFLFLTGDVVKNISDWDKVRNELDDIGVSWFVAPGNHDVESELIPDCESMQSGSGLESPYQIFTLGRNQFLVLNTSNAGWTIDQRQQERLRSHFQAFKKESIKNVFVFTHQMWWERNTPKQFQLDSVRPNSFALFEGASDFWTDAFPYFDSTEIETYFFAGDLGSDVKLESYYEDHHKNFHFYGSGMGGGTEDNYLVVSVYQNGSVQIQRVDF